MRISCTYPRPPSHRGRIARHAERALLPDERRQIVPVIQDKQKVVPIIQDQDVTTLIGAVRSLNQPLTGESCRTPAPKPSRREWLRLVIVLSVGIAAALCLIAGA